MRQVRAAVRRAALDPDVLPEELLDGQVAVRYADEADVAADADSSGRLETGVFGADALEDAVGADATAEIPTVADFVTVTWTCAAALRIPTRSTAAVPMAAIDSATASQPTASPAT